MRILIASDTYYPHINGASYFTQRLAETLATSGHEVAVVAPGVRLVHTKGPHGNVTLYGKRALKLPDLIHPEFYVTLPFSKRHARAIMEEFQPDIVHLQMHFTVGRKIRKTAEVLGIPVVLTNHFMPENLTPYMPFPEPVQRFIMKRMWNDFAKIAEKTDYVTTPTETAARLIRPHLSLSVESISCGIDLSRFSPGPKNDTVRERYHLPDAPMFLYVGRLDVEKNVDQVIRAFAQSATEHNFVLTLAGVGTERATLYALARELGVEDRVFFPGFITDEDLPDLYRLGEVFVIAGTAELQSIVTLEALSTALPAIGVNAGALPELIHDGKNGYLFEDKDIDTLAHRMTALATDPDLRTKMGNESMAVAKKHDIKATITAFERVYTNAQKK